MKHLLFFSLLLLLALVTTQAQNKVKVADSDDSAFKVLDTINYKCLYSYQHVKDSLNIESKKKASMLLLIGSKYTNFRNEYGYYIDSMRYLSTKGLVSHEQVNASFTQYTPGGPKYHILKNYTNQNTTILYPNTKGLWEAEETVSMDWTLGEKTDSIAGYFCKVAYTKFGGREYTAWYTPDIAMPYGPYKFSGLPGIIVKISDDQQSHVFELESMQKIKFPLIEENKKSINMTPKQLKKAMRNYQLGMIEKAKAWIKNDPEKVRKITKSILSENNPIELQ
ncbi:GLPGLI family protein [Ancylomarina sp.]|uniref:GLPGLI family protein n=1 Tax=Ancylomarina sp. TaxID=1970196 RepID=UPI00356974E4